MSYDRFDDINIAEYKILIYLWRRKDGDQTNTRRFVVDVSNILTSSISINKERNKPDSCSFELEYEQFKQRLKKEGTYVPNVMKPWLTEIKVTRDFETVFDGFLYSMNLNLGEVGEQRLTLRAFDWGEMLSKRYVSKGYIPIPKMSYPEIAMQLIEDAQHELNWIDNYAFEYSDEYFSGWEWQHHWDWEVTGGSPYTDTKNPATGYKVGDILTVSVSGGTCSFRVKRVEDGAPEELSFISSTLFSSDVSEYEKVKASGGSGSNAYVTLRTKTDLIPERSQDRLSGGGLHLDANNYIYTNTYGTRDYAGEKVFFSCWYKGSSTLTLTTQNGTWENPVNLSSYNITLPYASSWTYYENKNVMFSAGDIQFIKLYTSSSIDISELQIYRLSTEGDIYDLGIRRGEISTTNGYGQKYDYRQGRMKHYHRQNVKDALYNLSKLQADEKDGDQFEYIFDENKKLNVYKYYGNPIPDPATTLNYPGEIKNLSVERSVEEVTNLILGVAEEEVSLKVSSTLDRNYTRVWTTVVKDDSSITGSIDPLSGKAGSDLGVLMDIKSYDGVDEQKEIDEKAGGDLNSYGDIQEMPTITVDSNIFNPSNLKLGDAIYVQVLDDELFSYINDTYRVYSMTISVTKDAVEQMSVVLLSPSRFTIQIMSFPERIKVTENTVRRLQLR